MADSTNNNALNGLYPLAYLGVNPRTPPNFVQHPFPPTPTDFKNFQIGCFWLNTAAHTPPTANDLYVLVSLAGSVATWVPLSGGAAEFLTGNTGGPVPPTANNINVIGDGITITVAGNPGTSTLTISAVGTGIISSLTGNSGGAVFPTAGNINIIGSGSITVTGNPGTSTLTITSSATPGDTWSIITANQTAAVNNGYFCNKAGTLALALPAVSAIGNIIEVSNENTALGIQITQAAGQQILIGSSTTTLGATGTLTSSAVGDTLKLVCYTANTVWRAVSMVGNWSVV